MKKFIVLFLLTCMALSVFADNGSGNLFSFINTKNDLATPQVVFKKITADHNVVKNGKKGMNIKASFTIHNVKGKSCKLFAYFYKESGTALKDQNFKYRSSEGKVRCSKGFRPGHTNSRYTDLKIFIPYEELHVNGKHTIKYKLGVFYDGKFLGFSKFEIFSVSWNPKNPTPHNCMEVDASAVYSAMNKALSTFQLKLDRNGFISFAGYTKPVKLPELHVDKRIYDWKFYVQDVNTKRVTIRPSGSKLILKIEFEGDGSEIKGKRTGGRESVKDKRVPDLNWKGERSIEISFKPIAKANSISFDDFDVKVNGRIEINGHLDNLYDVFISPENILTHFFKKGVEDAFVNYKTQLANAIRPYLRNLSLTSFDTIKLSGSKMLFCKDVTVKDGLFKPYKGK